MKLLASILLLPLLALNALGEIPADEYSRPIFSDDFSGSGFGKRWGHYKSDSVVRDGVLVGITGETSDHNAVDNVRIEPEKDLEVAVKFRFTSDKAKGFNVWLDDKNYKGSHAGHICSVTVYPKSLTIADAKTGNFRNDIYEKRKTAGGLSDEEKAYLKTKTKSFNHAQPLALLKWHQLVVRTRGDEIEAWVDGTLVGAFESEGVAHDSKTLVSLTTNRIDVEYDDFSIKGVAKK